jgi:phosphatidylserine/phosphatidylglycerophosphate/cardiolipin synthase-like enzyme
MHHKFAIVDGVTLQTGSFNYTDSATRRNRENQLYLADPAIVREYRKEFDRLWDEGEPADAPSKSNRRTASRRER